MQMHSILIYDDSPYFSQSLSRFMETEKDFYSIQIALDGKVGLSQAMHMCPEVILLELNIGGPNDIDLIKSVRDLFPESIIIALTSNDADLYRSRAQAAGADEAVAKEHIGMHLIPIIRRQISQHQGQQHTPHR